MNYELRTMVERKVLGWPGARKKDEDRPGGLGVTIYRFRQWMIDHADDFR